MSTTNVTVVTDQTAPVNPPDVELLTRVAAGDRSALDELYRRHAPWLTTRLQRRCGDRDLVDTAVQDTFVNVWKQAGRFKPTGEVGAWIWTIGIRRLIDQMRKRPAPIPVEPGELPRVITEEVPLALGHTPLGQAFARLEPELQAVLAATRPCWLQRRSMGSRTEKPVNFSTSPPAPSSPAWLEPGRSSRRSRYERS